MSQYLNKRSGNRGCCSQPCRSSYDLYDNNNRLLIKEQHLLSLRDFSAAQQLSSMIDAGICSFKIEGRLKDLSYVKNITAYYRQLLDNIMNSNFPLSTFHFPLSKSSSGSCTFSFSPDPERTFNRGYTDYFLLKRQPMASFTTQKSIGKRMGKVTAVNRNNLNISGSEPFNNGDGLCYLDSDGRMQGFLVNDVKGRTVTPNRMPDNIKVGATIWRNNDQLFEKQLQGKSAERKIGMKMLFCAIPDGFALQITDEEGLSVTHSVTAEHQEARNSGGTENPIVKQLSKLGNTPFVATAVVDETQGRYFLPAGTLNQLRRKAVEQLVALRIRHHHPADSPRSNSRSQSLPNSQGSISNSQGSISNSQFSIFNSQFPTALDYRANVINDKAEKFYKHHGISKIERGLEQTEDYEGKALMTTKYCLRYELGCCLQGKNHGIPQVDLKPTDTLFLQNNGHRFRLDFDCQQCLMRIYKN